MLARRTIPHFLPLLSSLVVQLAATKQGARECILPTYCRLFVTLSCPGPSCMQAKLLALAPHTKGTLRRILVGSVTDYCLRHSASPVLIVKAEGTGGSEKKEL